MYILAIFILSTIVSHTTHANENSPQEKKTIARVIHVGNMTETTYKVFLKDGNHKYHEPVVLAPGCTQYMFCRTNTISLISFQPCKPTGKMFQIDKPISEMMRVDCYDQDALEQNFHFYLLPNNTIKSFPASSPQDLEILEQVKNHTFTPPSRPFTPLPFGKNS